MAKFKVAMIADKFLDIRPGEFLVCMFKGHPIASFSKSVKDGEIYEYLSLISSHRIDEHYRTVIMQHEWSMDESEITIEFCSYDMLLALTKRSIKDNIRDMLEEREPRDERDAKARQTFQSISQKTSAAGGCIVKTEFGSKYALLLGAVSSDEDYYYVMINEKYEIIRESCVGRFGEVVPVWPKQMNRFLAQNVTEKTSERVMQSLKLAFLDSPEVFFTPIYFNFQGKYDLSYLEAMSIVYNH